MLIIQGLNLEGPGTFFGFILDPLCIKCDLKQKRKGFFDFILLESLRR